MRRFSVWQPAAVLLISLVLSTALSKWPVVAAIGSLGAMGAVAVCWLCLTRFRREDAAPVLVGIALASLANLLLSAYQLLVAGEVRATGAMWHANFLGGLMALAALGLAAAHLRERRLRSATSLSILYAVGAVSAYACLLASMSRGGLLALAVGIAVWVYLRVRGHDRVSGSLRSHGPALAQVGLAVLAIAIGTAVIFMSGRFVDASQTVAMSGRDQLWRVALELITRRPWLGHGFGAWEVMIPKYEPAIDAGRIPHAHNLYLQLMLDVGTLGLLATLGFMYVFGRALVGRAKGGDTSRAAVIALGSAAAVNNVTDPLLYQWAYVGMLLLMVLTAVFGSHETANPSA